MLQMLQIQKPLADALSNQISLNIPGNLQIHFFVHIT